MPQQTTSYHGNPFMRAFLAFLFAFVVLIPILAQQNTNAYIFLKDVDCRRSGDVPLKVVDMFNEADWNVYLILEHDNEFANEMLLDRFFGVFLDSVQIDSIYKYADQDFYKHHFNRSELLITKEGKELYNGMLVQYFNEYHQARGSYTVEAISKREVKLSEKVDLIWNKIINYDNRSQKFYLYNKESIGAPFWMVDTTGMVTSFELSEKDFNAIRKGLDLESSGMISYASLKNKVLRERQNLLNIFDVYCYDRINSKFAASCHFFYDYQDEQFTYTDLMVFFDRDFNIVDYQHISTTLSLGEYWSVSKYQNHSFYSNLLHYEENSKKLYNRIYDGLRMASFDPDTSVQMASISAHIDLSDPHYEWTIDSVQLSYNLAFQQGYFNGYSKYLSAPDSSLYLLFLFDPSTLLNVKSGATMPLPKAPENTSLSYAEMLDNYSLLRIFDTKGNPGNYIFFISDLRFPTNLLEHSYDDSGSQSFFFDGQFLNVFQFTGKRNVVAKQLKVSPE